EASAQLQKIIDGTKDPSLKAAAYNALGLSYLHNRDSLPDALQNARWQFLWVDVIYNQDKAEHAKALYHLWRIFRDLEEPERARECLETLLTDRQYAGLEYQRRAQREKDKK